MVGPTIKEPATKPHRPQVASKAPGMVEGHQVRCVNGEQALAELMEGNKRFVAGTPNQKDLAAQRQATAGGQHPKAIVVYCADSRVPVEHIFDAGVGELFGIRNAGNVVSKIDIGTIEYGGEHLHAPLLLVLGHSKCGAVTAACSGGECPPNIGAIMKELKPAVKKGNGDVEASVAANVACVIKRIMKKSDIIRHMVEHGELKVVGGKYDIATGQVELIC